MNKHVGKTFLFLSVAALGMGGLTGCGNKLVNDAHTLNIICLMLNIGLYNFIIKNYFIIYFI